MLTSTSYMFFLKKLNTIRIHFWYLKYYKRNFIVLSSVMWMQKSKSNGSNSRLAIDLTKKHYIFRDRPSLILHSMIGYWGLHIRYSWKTKKLLKDFTIFFHLLFICQQMSLLSPNISKLGSLQLLIQYFILNSKAKKLKSTTLGRSNPILILLWNVYYTCTTYSLFFVFSLYLLNNHSIFSSYYFCV